jgi:hypothetical protein
MQLLIHRIHQHLFNEQLSDRLELITLYLASIGFLVHLGFVYAQQFGFIQVPQDLSGLLASPISAIYTPFSIILGFEVYLLIYHLPRSFSVSIAKQYEIISLILIRRVFKDISKLDFEHIDIFAAEHLQLLYDIVAFLIIFFLLFVFRYLLAHRKKSTELNNLRTYITIKKALCILIFPVLIGMSLFSFSGWIQEVYHYGSGSLVDLSNFNRIFYHDFFAALIIIDVLILLASFRYTNRYSLLIRNTGFVITTILIRLSFSTKELQSLILIVSGVLIGVIILYLYTLYEKVDEVTMKRGQLEEI